MKSKGKSKSKKTKNKLERAHDSVSPQNNLYNGKDTFALPNGDIYIGEYCAHRNGIIWREGEGSYYTQDGHIYEGKWHDDKLIDLSPIKIHYPNGDIFEGKLNKHKYDQGGEVIFQDGLTLSASFQLNKPAGIIHLIDSMGQLWKSYPNNNNNIDNTSGLSQTNQIFCRQEQTFFSNIHPLRGIKKEKLKEIEPRWGSKETSYCSEMNESSLLTHYFPKQDLEQIIFQKKPKISDQIDWNDCIWYEEFNKYKQKRDTILNKVKNHQNLNQDEKNWYRQYARARKERRTQEKIQPISDVEEKVNKTLLEKFYSTEHKYSAKPYATFYPTYYWHTKEEKESEEQTTIDESDKSIEKSIEENSEEVWEEESKTEAEEAYVTRNPSIACGTSSLFDMIKNATGAEISNPC